jgi:hypothetical protein
MRIDGLNAELLVKLDQSYKDFMHTDGSVLVQLDRAIYGCVESANLWHKLAKKTLEKGGYVQSPADLCIFNKYYKGNQVTICLHVDDFFVTCADADVFDELEAHLISEFNTGVNRHDGVIHSYIGMLFDFSIYGCVTVTMDGFVADVLKLSGINGTAETPAGMDLFELNVSSPELTTNDREIFHSEVAKLLYLAKRVRPDILLPCGYLATRVHDARESDRKKLNRIFKYLNAYPKLGLTFGSDGPVSVKCYADESYGVHADGKSHTGSNIVVGGTVLAHSTKQQIVTKSSTEAELVAASDMGSQLIWVRDFLLGQGYDVGPAVLYQDNQSTMALLKRGSAASSRSRHINIRYFWLKDRVELGELEVIYMPTEDMVSDLLTKPLQGEQFRKLRAQLLNMRE